MINDFLAGAIAMGFAIAALMFLKFWHRTREGLFLAFAGSFLLLSINHALLSLSRVPLEERSLLYLVQAGRLPADHRRAVAPEPRAANPLTGAGSREADNGPNRG